MKYLIQDDQLALVQFSASDMVDWAACWQDEATQLGYNFIPPTGNDWLQNQRIERFPFWVSVVNLTNGEKVGSLRLSPDPMPDLAIWVYQAHRGKGWGSRAYELACKYLFANGYDAIYAGCFLHNTHSSRILEKCGFKRYEDADVTETSVHDGTEIVMQGFRLTKGM